MRIELKIALIAVLVVGWMAGSNLWIQNGQNARTEYAMKQMHDSRIQQELVQQDYLRNVGVYLGWATVALLSYLIVRSEAVKLVKSLFPVLVAISMTGCADGCGNGRSYEPQKFETIDSQEEAFLIPLTGDGKEQEATDNEEYLRKNLVHVKQVKIPQVWRKKGAEFLFYNGEWADAARLIKVDTHPITREWTADPATGTSDKNQAIWVMTSDQVEFSTGWTITARIATKDDAVKFLHNYKNGSLTQVTDTEIRSKIQADFGLETTDLPMDELRKNAVPHITKVVNKVIEFFKGRGISITNLGITGGFQYKDKSIQDTMVRVFNAEQQKSIATAEKNAQEERNHTVIFEAQGKADALMKTKKAEADAIKLVADAKAYEITQANKDLKTYLELKRLEILKDQIQKWDGQFPKWFLGGGGNSTPNMLLQVPENK